MRLLLALIALISFVLIGSAQQQQQPTDDQLRNAASEHHWIACENESELKNREIAKLKQEVERLKKELESK